MPYQQPVETVPVDQTVDEQNLAQEVSAPLEQASVDSSQMPAVEDDAALLRWQSAEYIDHDRTTGWYIALAFVCVILILIAIFLMKSWTFALLIPIMAVALVVYTRRPPGILDYTLSRKGLYINDRLYPYDSFRSFSVVSHGGHNVASLIPRKRFQMAQTVYFPEEVGEPLVDMLAARMPMIEARPDFFDRITSRLRM